MTANKKNNPYTDAGLLLMRIAFGLLIWLHGIGKLQDLISGKNDFPDPLGIGSVPSLVLVTIAEFICPLFLMLGLFTRFALMPLIITLLVVVFVHEADLALFDKEAPVLFLAAFAGLFLTGPGQYALDARMQKKNNG